MKLLVTGGCGFLGSTFVRSVVATRPAMTVVVLDRLTYAGNPANLAEAGDNPRVRLVRGDIADPAAVEQAMDGVEAIVNFAAETHVDRALHDAAPFLQTNVVGTQVLLESAARHRIARFVQISTDEVYGPIEPDRLAAEDERLAPSNPYSASKAAADLLVRAYESAHGVPALIVRPSNAYGPFQYPEKLVPLMIANALAGRPLPVYGDGLHVREWVHAADVADAVLAVLERGRLGAVYNAGGGVSLANIDLVRRIVALAGASETLIRFVPDRPGHDRRYRMTSDRIATELDWRPRREFDAGLRDTVAWYAGHGAWLAAARDENYQRYYERQYGERLTDAPATTS
jgi:dTDP-glucose 4,6-dehydratase